MFFLKKNDLFWDGKNWIEDWHTAKCYGSAATAVEAAPDRACLATGFTLDQWEAWYNSTQTIKQRVPFEIAIAGHGNLIPYEMAILSGEYQTESPEPITALAIRSRLEDALKLWYQTPEGQCFWKLHGNLPCLENLSADLEPELSAYITETGIFNFQIRKYRIEQDWDYYSLIYLKDD